MRKGSGRATPRLGSGIRAPLEACNVAAWAHDVNNALTFVLLRAQVAMRRCQGSGGERQDWEQVIGGIERAIAVTERALGEAVAGPEGDNAAAESVFVRLVVGAAAAGALEGWGGRLEARVGEELAAAMHPVDLERVLVNLLANARRAAGERGRIWVEGEERAGRVTIRVRDDGPGFPAHVLAQGDRAVIIDAAGHGLGLGVCRRLVEAVGGALRLGAAPTGGAEVEVALPAARR